MTCVYCGKPAKPIDDETCADCLEDMRRMGEAEEATVFVACNSHRARHKLEALLGPLDAYYRRDFTAKPAHAYLIPADRLADARAITGVTRTREQSPDAWAHCWKM